MLRYVCMEIIAFQLMIWSKIRDEYSRLRRISSSLWTPLFSGVISTEILGSKLNLIVKFSVIEPIQKISKSQWIQKMLAHATLVGGFHHGTGFLPGQASSCKGMESTYSKYLSPLQTPNIAADNVCETQGKKDWWEVRIEEHSWERWILKSNECHIKRTKMILNHAHRVSMQSLSVCWWGNFY